MPLSARSWRCGTWRRTPPFPKSNWTSKPGTSWRLRPSGQGSLAGSTLAPQLRDFLLEGPALSHPAGELVRVEIVPPGADLAAADLEGAHDRQLERLAGEREDVHPLRHHDRTIGCDVDDAEIDALDAGRARAYERGDRAGDVLPAGDRRLRDVVVNGVLGEECGQLGCSHVVGPRGAEPAHHLDRAFHLAPPMRCCQFGETSVVGAAPLGSGCGWSCSERGAVGGAWPAAPVARTRISTTARIEIVKATPAATSKARSNPVARAWRKAAAAPPAWVTWIWWAAVIQATVPRAASPTEPPTSGATLTTPAA